MAKHDNNGSNDEQAIRNAHYAEDGVDDQGNAPRNVTFDESGQEALPEAEE